MSEGNYYDLLGVDRSADAKAIKAAFRKMAMEFHPDRNPDNPSAEANFKKVNEAYAVLSDEAKRRRYDQIGHGAWKQSSSMGGGNGAAGAGNFEDLMREAFGGSFDDLFGEMFGRGGRAGRGRGGPARGQDLRYDIEIELEDVFHGKTVTLKVPVAETCDVCTGSGAEPGSGVETCPTCAGAGMVRMSQGLFTMQRTCPTCGGQGQYVKNPCTACDGAGRARKEKTLQVQIPAGVEDGTRVRIAGEGDQGARGGPRGDLYVFVGIRPHDIFERDTTDLYCRAPVTMVTAALGGEAEIPTIDGGRVKVKVPEGSQTGKRVRVRGKGMAALRSQTRGDMIVELFVETPTRLNPRQRELLEEFIKESCEDCHPEHKNFFERARKFWDNLKGEEPRA
jgi:molecular chaperone DnaJ